MTKKVVSDLIKALDAAWATVAEPDRLAIRGYYYTARSFANKVAEKNGIKVEGRPRGRPRKASTEE
jgi:hypothetical protein